MTTTAPGDRRDSADRAGVKRWRLLLSLQVVQPSRARLVAWYRPRHLNQCAHERIGCGVWRGSGTKDRQPQAGADESGGRDGLINLGQERLEGNHEPREVERHDADEPAGLLAAAQRRVPPTVARSQVDERRGQHGHKAVEIETASQNSQVAFKVGRCDYERP